MLQLLTSSALWTLAALALPLAIHLWRPPPRTVRLGSLRFLAALPRRLHDLRWRERLLLAARLSLLALLAFLLTAPRWQRRPPSDPQRWILLDSDAAPTGASLALLRARQSTGYETHDLSPDLWSSLREADAELPPGSTLTVFSPGRLASLHGERPRLQHCRVEWITTPAAPAAAPAPTPPSPPPARVLILHDADRAADARDFAAALRAAGRPVNVRTGPPIPPPPTSPGTDWIIWLSTQPAPGLSPHLLSELPAPAVNSPASWIVPASVLPVRLWQRAAAPVPPPGAVYWTDGFGQPLLTRTATTHGEHWQFFGRFDPAWTDLPRGSAFPSWLRALILQPLPTVPDRRLADPSQCRPSDAPPAGPDLTLPRATISAVDLHLPLWTLAALLFVLERVWSHRRPTP